MRKLKAFAVTEEDEGTGSIFFAGHDIVARRRGANEFAGGDISQVICRRAPWADEYSDRPLPAKVMIAHGWHFECSGCGARIDEDSLHDRRLSIDGVLGTQYSAVFCGSRCMRKHLSLQRRRKAEERRAIDAFKAIVRERFPDADFCDEVDGDRYRERHRAYVIPGLGGWHWKQVIVAFRFPGMKIAAAHYRLDGGYGVGPYLAGYTCCNGDREAFEAWASAALAALSARTENKDG